MVTLEAYIKHHRRVNSCSNHMGYSPSSPSDQMKQAIIYTNSRLSVMEKIKKGKKKSCQVPLSVNLMPVSTLQSLSQTPWTVAHNALLSMGFPRREYWSGLPFPTPGDLPNPEIKLVSLALAGKFFTTSAI